MEIEIAKSIVQDLVYFHFWSEGIHDKIEDDLQVRLENYSLEEMLEASKLVDENNGEEFTDPDGKKYFKRQVNVADRLIAAMYVLLHYQPYPADDCKAIISNRKKGLYCVYH